MRIFRLMLVVALAAVAGSCIRKEPLNAECDIMAAILDGDILNRAPIIENNKVIIYVKNDVGVKELAPEFVLTPGASIAPASGTVRDFSSPQTYMTSSEDGKWHKVYTVEVRRNSSNLEFNFENVRTVSALMGACSYDVFYEIGANGAESLAWASGNAGFALTLQGTTPSTFPTFQSDNGWTGKCVEMVTRATGSFGESVKKPLAAGNLFLGKFDMNNAVNKPLESTQFGTPFINVPLSLSGYYKYRPGETYCRMNSTTGKLEPVDGKTDECNIYAVFFEVTDDMEWLDGTNVMAEDNPNILAVARLSPGQRGLTADWAEFNLPFVYREGKTVDPEKLAEGKYSITIVFSSSIDGDYFSGAIGSTLLVDEVFISCQNQ
ncbi:MAG: PCMD domain-containing protein [Duncaniella sp.]|nr:PCMD domain-containing protein [Duncaniella sp.]